MQRHDPLGPRPAFCLRGVLDDGRWLFVMARSMDVLVLCACERIEASGEYGWTRWAYGAPDAHVNVTALAAPDLNPRLEQTI